MRKLLGFVLASVGAAAIAGAAAASSRDTHTLNVPLPDGSTAKIEYVGDTAPKVSITQAPLFAGFGSLGMFGRTMADMQHQMDAMMRQVEEIERQPIGSPPNLNVAGYGNAPSASTSITIVSTSNGTKTCTRTTEVTAQGAGKPPKVMSRVTGDCGGQSSASPERPSA